MSEEHEQAPETTPGAAPEAPEPGRKEKAAARRAEFEAKKAAKDAEKAAAKAAALEEKLAAKQAKQAAKNAKNEAKAAKSAGKSDAKPPREKQAAKPPKDPYRPRFAVAPGKVRGFTVLAAMFALIHVTGAVLLLLETTSTPVFDVVPSDASGVAYLGAALALLVAGLWIVSSTLLCTGRILGRHLGVAAVVLGLPLSLVAAPLLFSADVRDWAL